MNSMQREYKNVIFTEHAIKRMMLRRISQDAVVRAITTSDRKFKEDDGDTRFIKTVRGREVHVVGSYLRDERRWLVVSAWVRGEDDPIPLWRRLLSMPVRILRSLS